MTGGPGVPDGHCISLEAVENQDANAMVFSESQGFGKDECSGLGATEMKHQALRWEQLGDGGIVFILI